MVAVLRPLRLPSSSRDNSPTRQLAEEADLTVLLTDSVGTIVHSALVSGNALVPRRKTPTPATSDEEYAWEVDRHSCLFFLPDEHTNMRLVVDTGS